MNENKNKLIESENRYNSPLAFITILAGLLLNYLGSYLAKALELPIYLDNIGTIVASILGGYLPGIITAVLNNMINYMFDKSSIYYASVSALIAVTAVYMYRKGRFKKLGGIVLFVLALTFLGGFMGGFITWILYGAPTEGITYELMNWIYDNLHVGTFWSHILSASTFDLIDKAITVIVAFIIVKLVPEKYKAVLFLSGWKQTPILEEAYKYEDRNVIRKDSLNTRIGLMLIISMLMIAVVVTLVSATLFRENSKKQYLEIADGIARLAASAVDPEKVDEYIEKGEAVDGYAETEDLLTRIRDSSPDIEYVYVYKILEDGCHVVFDLDTEELEGEEPGVLVPFDESFKEIVPSLLKGEKIEPIETNDTYGWLLTAYEPVYNSAGECVCYACADVKVDDIKVYEKDFVTKVVLLFFGFAILILVIGLWISKYNLILPVNSMATVASEFAESDDSDDEEMAELQLAKILELKISTGDEIQALYEAFCTMTTDTVQHMKDIRAQSDSIDKLQRGLIMTMADMVEGRDSDTGNHVRKTAAYTRIIMEGLRRLGYYKDKLTDQYLEDVERSAPLHDVGKIAVSDVILNKPGKLTDEEYEIMKTHTTAGKDMLDQVIETVNGESYLHEARNLAAYHHEKWNGKGYPEGLSGEDIPLSARVMAIADVFDALSSKRVYKDAMPFDKAVSIIKEDSGTHFDPKCVEAFLDSLDEVKDVLDYYNDLESSGIRVRGNEADTEDLNEYNEKED